MTISEIIDYVVNSPENSNPNVLRSMLNEIEGGGGDTPVPSGEETMVINISNNQLNKTWQEIEDALSQDIIVYCKTGIRGAGRMYVIETIVNEEEEQYAAVVVNENQFNYYITDSTSGYPTLFSTPTTPPNAS